MQKQEQNKNKKLNVRKNFKTLEIEIVLIVFM